MRPMIQLTPKLKTKLAVSTRLKLTIAASAFAFGAFIIFMLINNFGTFKKSKAANQMLYGQGSNTSLAFNGTSDYVMLGNADLSLSNKLTVTAWVKWDTLPSKGNPWANIVTMSSNTSNGDDGQFWLQHNSNNTNFEFAIKFAGGARKVINGTTQPSQGIWYHLAGTYNGNTMCLYVNGILEKSINTSGDIYSLQSRYRLTFGEWAYNGNNYRRFKGELDEITIWKTALNQNQIRAMMCQETKPNSSKLKGYWRMDDKIGLTITDLTGNNVGTISGATWKLSGAPIGTSSKYDFTNPSSITFNHVDGDVLTVDSINLVATGVLLYYRDTLVRYDTVLFTHSVPVYNHYWGVFFASNQNYTYRTTYTYVVNTNVTDESSLTLLNRRTNDTLSWNVNTTHPDMLTKTIKTVGRRREEFALADKGSSTLPVAFAGAEAVLTPDAKNVVINWRTMAEINNNKFTIEKSTDAKNFKSIGIVQGAGNSNSLKSYNFIDKEPQSGINYYRISQTDFDGTTVMLKTLAVKNTQTEIIFNDFQVYPNPFVDLINVSLTSETDGDVEFEIKNTNGVTIYNAIRQVKSGRNNIEISDFGNVSHGLYFLSMKCNGIIKNITKLTKL